MVVAKHHKNDGGLDDVVRTCVRTDARKHSQVSRVRTHVQTLIQ
jgi:hypothetical protein